MADKIATITFTLGHDLEPILLKVEGALYEKEITDIMEDIRGVYHSPDCISASWMQAVLSVFEKASYIEGECSMSFHYKDIFLN